MLTHNTTEGDAERGLFWLTVLVQGQATASAAGFLAGRVLSVLAKLALVSGPLLRWFINSLIQYICSLHEWINPLMRADYSVEVPPLTSSEWVYISTCISENLNHIKTIAGQLQPVLTLPCLVLSDDFTLNRAIQRFSILLHCCQDGKDSKREEPNTHTHTHPFNITAFFKSL